MVDSHRNDLQESTANEHAHQGTHNYLRERVNWVRVNRVDSVRAGSKGCPFRRDIVGKLPREDPLRHRLGRQESDPMEGLKGKNILGRGWKRIKTSGGMF